MNSPIPIPPSLEALVIALSQHVEGEWHLETGKRPPYIEPPADREPNRQLSFGTARTGYYVVFGSLTDPSGVGGWGPTIGAALAEYAKAAAEVKGG